MRLRPPDTLQKRQRPVCGRCLVYGMFYLFALLTRGVTVCGRCPAYGMFYR